MTHLRPALHCMMTSRTAVKLAQTDVDAAQALSVSGAMNPMPPAPRRAHTSSECSRAIFYASLSSGQSRRHCWMLHVILIELQVSLLYCLRVKYAVPFNLRFFLDVSQNEEQM